MPDRKSFAALVLEDGRAFVGASLGADVIGEGEVVFNTAMTGYQEVLTDPSYAGQMVCMTYPLQGNYGVRDADAESARPWARALVVRWACPSPSHHSSEASLDEYLRRWNVAGIADIDTRALTRHIRSHGTQRAVLVHESVVPSEARLAELARAANRVTPLVEQDLVAQTSRTSREEWFEPMPPELRARKYSDGEGLLIAVIDYEGHKIFVRHVLSHKDYDKGLWKKDTFGGDWKPRPRPAANGSEPKGEKGTAAGGAKPRRRPGRKKK